MKKILLFLGIILSNYSYSQTVLLEESFDDITTLTDWTISNQSTEPNNDWIQGNSEIFDAYEGSSFLAANYAASLWDYISLWMISPTLELKDGDIVTFYTRNPGDGYADRLQFRLSSEENFVEPVGETDLGSFTNLLLDINPNLEDFGYPTEWTLQSIEISGIGNTPVPVNLAFRYFVEDAGYFGNNGDYIGIDALTVTREDDPEPAGCLTAINGQWPDETYTPQCYATFASTTFGDNGWFGEYSLINVNEGVEYTFATDVETAFITIGDEAGQTVLAAGTGNVVWTSTFTGKVRYYTHSDEACSEDGGWVDRMVKCGEEIIVESCEDNFVPSNGFEDGATLDDQRLAVDVIVGAGGFTVTGIQINAFSETADATFSAKLHTDNNGVPGDELLSTEGTVIASTVVGNNSGVDVYAFDVKFDDPFVLDANSTYWIEIIASGVIAWEVSLGYHMGHGIAFNNPNTGNQWVSYDAVDLVYALICEDLGASDLAQFDFTYYPNPVKDYLTIQSKLAVKFVEVYNMAGQRISNNLKYVNGQVNTSQLPSGVYVFRVGLENGQIETFKVIKK